MITAVPLALISRNNWNIACVCAIVEIAGWFIGEQHKRIVRQCARAIATRCCSPPESSCGKDVAFDASPVCVSNRATRGPIVLFGVPTTSSAKAMFFFGSAVGQQPEILKHDSKSPTQFWHITRLERAAGVSRDSHFATGWSLRHRDELEERAFSPRHYVRRERETLPCPISNDTFLIALPPARVVFRDARET